MLSSELVQPSQDESPLGLELRQSKGTFVGGAGVGRPAQPSEEIGPGRVRPRSASLGSCRALGAALGRPARLDAGTPRIRCRGARELALVSRLLDAVPSGPAALILGGETGIGKSTLWLEALSQARARSYRVLSCRPNESEAKLSFAAPGDLLEGVVDESLEDLSPPQRSALEVALLRTPPGRRLISGRSQLPFTERW